MPIDLSGVVPNVASSSTSFMAEAWPIIAMAAGIFAALFIAQVLIGTLFDAHDRLRGERE